MDQWQLSAHNLSNANIDHTRRDRYTQQPPGGGNKNYAEFWVLNNKITYILLEYELKYDQLTPSSTGRLDKLTVA